MSDVATSRMSSKGQVVIPESVRDRLKLKPGAQFIVVGEGDVVILKAITPPALNEFEDLIAEARRQGRKAGVKQSDIAAATAKIRGRE